MNTLVKLLLIEAVILVGQVVLYYGCEFLQHDFHDVKRPVDEKVPVLPWTTGIYVMWFPMIFFFPFLSYFCSKSNYVVYQIAIIASNIISPIVYLIYPTTFHRDPPPATAAGWALGFVYKASFRGINCAPSLHCSQCMIVMAAAIMCSGMNIWLRLLFIILSAAIIVATQTTKQHVLTDAVSAIPVAAVSVLLGIAAVRFLDACSWLELLGL